jgi:hypothetical protein
MISQTFAVVVWLVLVSTLVLRTLSSSIQRLHRVRLTTASVSAAVSVSLLVLTTLSFTSQYLVRRLVL